MPHCFFVHLFGGRETWPRALLFLAMASAAVGTASAWTPLETRDGRPLAWAEGSFPLPLAEGGPHWDAAAMAWTDVTSARFRPVDAQEIRPDGVVAIREIHTEEEWRDVVGDGALVAFTLTTEEDGVLSDADVVLNGASYAFSEPGARGTFSLRTVMAHELGHVIGLGHSCGDDGAPSCFSLASEDPRLQALMTAALPPGNARPVGADDVEGASMILAPGPRRTLTFGESIQDEAGTLIYVENAEEGDDARGWVGEEAVSLSLVRVGDRWAVRLGAENDVTVALWSMAGQVTVSEVLLPESGMQPDAGVGPRDAGIAIEPIEPQGCGMMSAGRINGSFMLLLGALIAVWGGRKRRRGC